VISHCSGFLTILNGNYDLVIIDVHAMTKLCISIHKIFSCELKIYDVIVTCMNHVCCTCYTLIVTLCIFKVCINFKANLFIAYILSTVLCWIQKLSVFDQYVLTNTAQSE
jgi:hypothetical protein